MSRIKLYNFFSHQGQLSPIYTDQPVCSPAIQGLHFEGVSACVTCPVSHVMFFLFFLRICYQRGESVLFLDWTPNQERPSGHPWRSSFSHISSNHQTGCSSFQAHFWTGLLMKRGHKVFLGDLLLLALLAQGRSPLFPSQFLDWISNIRHFSDLRFRHVTTKTKLKIFTFFRFFFFAKKDTLPQ